MIERTFTVSAYSVAAFLSIWTFQKAVVDAPHIWIEVKTLQTWINTAFISMFALFTYPFSILVILIQIIFIKTRPFANPENLPASKWAREVISCVLWVLVTTLTFTVVLFGTTID